jgi:hypothetical protein
MSPDVREETEKLGELIQKRATNEVPPSKSKVLPLGTRGITKDIVHIPRAYEIQSLGMSM